MTDATTGTGAARKPTTPDYSKGKWAAAFTRAPGERRYWLVKQEPSKFSFDDLLASPGQTTVWDGVRNSAARNFMRDGMKLGDQVFFYHSSAQPPLVTGVVGIATATATNRVWPKSVRTEFGHTRAW